MASEIRVNSLSSRTGLSTVTFTDTGPIFSGITTFQDNSGFNVGTGGSIFSPASNTVTLGTNNAERLRITNTGRVLINASSDLENSGAAKLQIAHTSGALLALGRDDSSVSADNDLGKIAFYGNDGGSYEKVAQITCEANGSHASGDKPGRLLFATTADGASSPTERLRIASSGGHRIQCNESWHAANLSECNTDKLALNINKTRQGETKGIAIGCVGGGSGSTGIQCYDTSNNSANNLELNPFGGNVGIGEDSPDRLLHIKGASSTAYSGGSDTADYNLLKIENTTDNKSAGVFFLIGGNGEAAITATEVADGNTDICFQNRGGGVRSEKLRITSDGKMGVGTASPNHKITLHNSGTGTFDALNITSGLTNSVGLQFGIDSASNVFFWHTANGGIKFATNNVERARVTNNGITFNGDTSAANALDDYEEGTFTPSYDSGLTSPSYTGTSGNYTKIGNLVTFTIRIRATGTNSSSHLQIAGLPFPSNSNNEGSVSFGYTDNINGSDGIAGHIPEGSSEIHIYQFSGSNFNGNNGNGVSGRTLHMRGFYYTNS